MVAATVLAGGIDVPTDSGFIPTAGPLLLTFPLALKLFPLLVQLLLRIQEERAKKLWINETIAKYMQEYQDFTSELPLEKRIELISDLVKYQKNYSKVYKFQSQQRRPMTKKQKKDFYMTVIRNNLGWKVKDFKGFNLKHEHVKKQKTSEEAPEIEKDPEEISEEKVKEMMQLVPIEEVYAEALQVKHPIID
uniref:Uncharacterized protein n=1 Tax=Tanacetum cinerariifolium TaxID=118510 RepID=A0A6L2LL03_TANCI|nr:hypothetical protein [Tanacetum cinerariifolium]